MTDTTQAADPTPDQLRQMVREARNSSGSASDDCGPAAYVLHGWRAALAAQAVPAGYRLVPEEPTEEMMVAWDNGGVSWEEGYRAMLAASPAPAEAKEEPMLNGLTKAETEATASVFGLTPQPQAAQPVACLIRSRSLGPAASIAHDKKDHFSEWGAWQPASLAHGRAVTDPVRNSPELWQRVDLYTAAPALTEEQEREAFERWFYASKYAQVVAPKAGDVQRAWDAFRAGAALRSTQGGSDGN